MEDSLFVFLLKLWVGTQAKHIPIVFPASTMRHGSVEGRCRSVRAVRVYFCRVYGGATYHTSLVIWVPNRALNLLTDTSAGPKRPEVGPYVLVPTVVFLFF